MTFKAFLKHLDANFKITAPLYNWRRMLEGLLDFEVFRDNFLTLTGEISDTIVCVMPCSERCRIRKIVNAPNGRIRAVCSRNENDYFHVPVEEIVVYRLDINALIEAIADAFRKNGFKRPEVFLLPETIDVHVEAPPEPTYPVQHVFPFAKRHIYKETDGENDYWYVDGKPIGQIYKRRNSRKARILNLLYREIGNGWIAHQTFINMTGWTEEEYYGKDRTDPGRMQQNLRYLRKRLGIDITFNVDYGVRFAENVVKYRMQYRNDFF